MKKIDIEFPDKCAKFIDLQCNGRRDLYTEMPEIKNIDKYLSEISEPSYVMDIGSGIGRASVFIKKYYGWDNSIFLLLDGDSGDKQFHGLRSKNHEYYNSIKMAKAFCGANEVKMIPVDVSQSKWISEISHPVDLAYSFLSVGFHWPIDLYLNKIHGLLRDGAFVIFGTRNQNRKSWVDQQVESVNAKMYDIVEVCIESAGSRSSVMVLKKITRG